MECIVICFMTTYQFRPQKYLVFIKLKRFIIFFWDFLTFRIFSHRTYPTLTAESQLGIIPITDNTPIDNLPKSGEMSCAAILVIQIISMLPYIESQQRPQALLNGKVPVGTIKDLKYPIYHQKEILLQLYPIGSRSRLNKIILGVS